MIKHITKYKPKDFAELLNVLVKTLQRWDRDNVLKAFRTPTDIRYYLEFKGINNVDIDEDEEVAKSLQNGNKPNKATKTKD